MSWPFKTADGLVSRSLLIHRSASTARGFRGERVDCVRRSEAGSSTQFRILCRLRVYPLPVNLGHRAQVVIRVLLHPRVVELGDQRGYGQRVLEIPPQLQGVVEVLQLV